MPPLLHDLGISATVVASMSGPHPGDRSGEILVDYTYEDLEAPDDAPSVRSYRCDIESMTCDAAPDLDELLTTRTMSPAVDLSR